MIFLTFEDFVKDQFTRYSLFDNYNKYLAQRQEGSELLKRHRQRRKK